MPEVWGEGGHSCWMLGLLEFSALSSTSATHIPFPFAGLLFVNLSEAAEAGLGEFLAVFKQEAPAALSAAKFCRNSVQYI